MKRAVGIFCLVFAVTLAVVVGKQMSSEAMAVVIGVVCGVAAGIPTSVLLLVVLTRREQRRLEDAERQVQRQGSSPYRHGDPPVVVIQGGHPLQLPNHPPFQPPPGLPHREYIEAPTYRVLGDE